MVVTRNNHGKVNSEDEGVPSGTGTATTGTNATEATPGASNAGDLADASGTKDTPAASTAMIIERRTGELMPPPTNTETRKPARSHRSKASSKRLLAELEAKERLAELELKRIRAETELEKIRQERLNIVSSPEESEGEEEDLAPQRITDWFNQQRGQEAAIEIPIHEGKRELAACATELRKRQEPHQDAQHRPSHAMDVSSLTAALTEAIHASKSNNKFIADLPTFSGLCTEWLQFKAAYNESSPSFSASENVARIRRSLKGVAWEAVSALLISQPHPDDVIKALERRYGRPDALLISETEKMKGLPRLTESPRDLCIFASQIANTVATIEILKKPQYLYNPEVLRTIVDKLTPILRSKWYDYAANKEDTPELKKIAEFLNHEADKCAPYSPPENTPENKEGRFVKKKPERAYAVTAEGENKKEDKQACPLCKPANHQLPSCPKFNKIDTNERWEVAKKHNICYRCLVSTHRRFACHAKPCGQQGCLMRHHRLLHHERAPPPATATSEEPPPHKLEEVVASAVEQVVGTSTGASRAYLKITPVILRGPRAEVEAFALLDEGSTVTIIDSTLADTLGLDGPIEPMWVQGVSGKEMAHRKSKRVEIYISSQHGGDEHRISNAHTVANLDFATQSVGEREIKDCAHLNEIKYKLVYRDATPKILIGQDYWDLIVSREIRKGRRDQLVASKTLLGWVVHGCRTSQAEPIAYSCAHFTQAESTNQNRNAREHATQFRLATRAIRRNHYTDDYLQSFATIQEAKQVTREVDCVHKKAGFQLRGWATNTSEATSSVVGSKEREENTVPIGGSEIEKTLGLLWDTNQDNIRFRFNTRRAPPEVIDDLQPPTKREALSVIISIFYPLGLITPITTPAKRIMQDTWRYSTNWDEAIPEELCERWNEWLRQFRDLGTLNIPRCYDTTPASRYGLHTFVDSSEEAYDSAVYWRMEQADGSITVALAAAKKRVTPTKPITAPRLELQAAVLGVRLAKTVAEEHDLEIASKTYWSDSCTALAWIRAEPRTYKTLVAHQLAEIEDTTKKKEWRWVPSAYNAADDATRATPIDFDSSHRWINGPPFLYSQVSAWPMENTGDTFWRRCAREYAPLLQHRREPYDKGVSPAVGDVVVICDSNLPRNTWPRGRVTRTYPGKDGVVRVVDVTTSRGHILRRATKKIVVLPVGSQGDGGRNVHDG